MKTTEKIQRFPIGQAGSFVNQLMSNNDSLPVLGEGVKDYYYYDWSF